MTAVTAVTAVVLYVAVGSAGIVVLEVAVQVQVQAVGRSQQIVVEKKHG